MRKILKQLLLISILVLMISITPITAFAKTRICGYKGCTRSTEGCNNGTVYCNIHAAVYAREKGYRTCSFSGCNAVVSSGSYCSKHTCQHPKCKNRALTTNGYCSDHQCKYPGCTACAFYTSGKDKGYCTAHASSSNKKHSYSSSSKSSTNKSSSVKKSSNKSSSKKTTYNTLDFDPDDYDDPDDYAEDAWGNDFEDYDDAYEFWENW